MSEYHKVRAEMASSCARFPNITDYEQALEDVDYRETMNVQQAVSELRNQYSIMHHVIRNNWETIIQPRGNNTPQMH